MRVLGRVITAIIACAIRFVHNVFHCTRRRRHRRDIDFSRPCWVRARITGREMRECASASFHLRSLYRLPSLRRRNQMDTAACYFHQATHLKAHGGDRSVLSHHTTPPCTYQELGKKRMRSPMALQVNSMGRVDIQVRTARVEQDRQPVALELLYGRRGANFNRAATAAWWRAVWRDSEPHEAHFAKMHRTILKDMAGTLRRPRLSL